MAQRGGKRSTSFKPGHSGNPKGRPKADPEVKDLAKAHTVEAIETAVRWMRSDNPTASTKAIEIILERGHGKAKQVNEHTGPDGGPIEVTDGRERLAHLIGRFAGTGDTAEGSNKPH